MHLLRRKYGGTAEFISCLKAAEHRQTNTQDRAVLAWMSMVDDDKWFEVKTLVTCCWAKGGRKVFIKFKIYCCHMSLVSWCPCVRNLSHYTLKLNMPFCMPGLETWWIFFTLALQRKIEGNSTCSWQCVAWLTESTVLTSAPVHTSPWHGSYPQGFWVRLNVFYSSPVFFASLCSRLLSFLFLHFCVHLPPTRVG